MLEDKYKGLMIESARLVDNSLILEFEGGVKLKIFDDGQSCCESRYMVCDDNLSDLLGGKLTDIYESGREYKDSEYDCTEIAFVKIVTDKDHITIVNYNEHNGYYGGFWLVIKEI